jgi:hypothetical protein
LNPFLAHLKDSAASDHSGSSYVVYLITATTFAILGGQMLLGRLRPPTAPPAAKGPAPLVRHLAFAIAYGLRPGPRFLLRFALGAVPFSILVSLAVCGPVAAYVDSRLTVAVKGLVVACRTEERCESSVEQTHLGAQQHIACRTQYCPQVRFREAPGEGIEHVVPAECAYVEHHPDELVTIRYWPGSPESAFIADEPMRTSLLQSAVLLPFALLFALALGKFQQEID